MITDLLDYDFMRRALVAALLVGIVAPMIGAFLVQRRLALLGDGMGHVALTGVGLAFLVGWAPIPTALATAALGAVVIEVIRARSRTAGDLALALLFYGGIAGGVLFTSLAGNRSSTALNQYLFGSISTVSSGDLVALVVVAILVVVTLAVLGRELFVLTLDVDLAAAQGIKTTRLSMVLTVLAAVAVVIGMRTVGLLLVSAIMIVPVAAAQQVTRSFRSTIILAVTLSTAASVLGVTTSFSLNVPPGPAIVFLALGAFLGCTIAAFVRTRLRQRPSDPVHVECHPDGTPITGSAHVH